MSCYLPIPVLNSVILLLVGLPTKPTEPTLHCWPDNGRGNVLYRNHNEVRRPPSTIFRWGGVILLRSPVYLFHFSASKLCSISPTCYFAPSSFPKQMSPPHSGSLITHLSLLQISFLKFSLPIEDFLFEKRIN